jgi:hypothetical protein
MKGPGRSACVQAHDLEGEKSSPNSGDPGNHPAAVRDLWDRDAARAAASISNSPISGDPQIT